MSIRAPFSFYTCHGELNCELWLNERVNCMKASSYIKSLTLILYQNGFLSM